jgi:hypothetical protein
MFFINGSLKNEAIEAEEINNIPNNITEKNKLNVKTVL